MSALNEDTIMVPLRELQQEQRTTRMLAEQLAAARATIKRLNRRCQIAESAARVTIDQCRREGVGLSKVLAHHCYTELRTKIQDLLNNQL